MVLVIVTVILISILVFFIISPDWRFRDPWLAYPSILIMIGVCIGLAVFLKLKLDLLKG
jgi:hypothetical protein